jgi:hypothetical protein
MFNFTSLEKMRVEMTISDFKKILAEYDDEMELFFIAEDRIGSRRLLLNIYDSVDFRKRVILTGSLSKAKMQREIYRRLC